MTATPAATHSSLLNAARRSRELHELASGEREIDLLVIGGGVTGTGVALDAASRGLSVVLAEAHDLAFGTSRWSSKLVHGGLRYLASGDIAVARESSRERHLLMTKIAPHLSHALPQLVPYLPGITQTQRTITRIGFTLGDGLRRWAHTPSSLLPAPTRVSAAEALRLAPALRTAGLRGGVVSTDGQLEDDAKLVTAIARTAAAYGATILTGISASDVSGAGALLTDQRTGESFRLRARSVVNATGVWASDIDPEIQLRPSRGTHLVVSAARLGNPRAALTVPHPGSVSRFVFALPQRLGRVYLGLTDEDAPGPVPDVPQPSETEIDFLLRTVSTALEHPLERADVLGTFAGLRPLISTGTSASTADISRRHHVAVSRRGVVNVLGGKLTTYRAMAEDAVDLACRTAGLPDPGCATTQIALVGAPGSALSAEAERAQLLTSCDRPEEQITPGIAVTRAEIAHAVRAEGALTVDDVLDRRTRIGLVAADRAAAFSAVSELLEETLT